MSLSAILAGPALAADLPTAKAPAFEPVLYAPSPWQVRVRGLVVIPEPDADLHLGGTPLSDADVKITTSVVPELDITYFFTPNIAVELILGVTPHKIKGKGSLAGTPVGDAWLLPPTLLLQYHFDLTDKIKPYVGAGVNYTVFFDQQAKGGVVTKVDLENTFGFALQAGVDYFFDEHWGVNFDVKKLWLRPDVKLNSVLGPIRGKVNIDPWIIGAGVTYRF